MTEPIDFTTCPRVAARAYNGANGEKIAVIYWMVEVPRLSSLRWSRQARSLGDRRGMIFGRYSMTKSRRILRRYHDINSLCILEDALR